MKQKIYTTPSGHLFVSDPFFVQLHDNKNMFKVNRTFPKPRKRGKIDISNTYIHDRSLS
jgi:hypothetical protein